MIRQLPPAVPLPWNPAPADDRRTIDGPLAAAWRRIDPAAPRAPAAARPTATVPARDQTVKRRRQSLAREIDGLMRPDMLDSGLLASPRSLHLLRHVAETLLPDIAMDEEARASAIALIEEEMDLRVSCAQRRLDGL